MWDQYFEFWLVLSHTLVEFSDVIVKAIENVECNAKNFIRPCTNHKFLGMPINSIKNISAHEVRNSDICDYLPCPPPHDLIVL